MNLTQKITILLFCIKPLFCIEKPIVHSFDVFDTLVGRLYCTPDSIFDLVEKKSSFPNFKQLRKKAEHISDGTFDDIYRKLQILTDLNDSIINDLKKTELETELDHIFPINHNINLIQDGDLLISDTYYSDTQLRDILSKIGVKKKINLYVSPKGKHSGLAWKELLQKYTIRHHMGDNTYSDVASPNMYGIRASLFNPHLTPIEQAVYNLGFNELAYFMRTIRLLCPYDAKSQNGALWIEQSQFNLPILILASNLIANYCHINNITRLLFSARDCYHWIKVFKTLHPNYESIYFYSSRLAYKNPSNDYIDYVKNLYNQNSLILDGQGTGKTCFEFFNKNFNITPNYIPIVGANTDNPNIGLSTGHWDYIEFLNYAPHGSLESFTNKEPKFIPIEYDPNILKPILECIDQATLYLRKYELKISSKDLLNQFLFTLDSKKPIISYYINHQTEHKPIN